MIVRVAAIVAAAVLTCGAAAAGTLSNGVWTPTGCGAEPSPPAIDDSSEKNFSKSLDAADDFEKKEDTYFGCISKEASTDSNAVATAYNAAKTHQNDVKQKLTTDEQAGMDKYAAKKK